MLAPQYSQYLLYILLLVQTSTLGKGLKKDLPCATLGAHGAHNSVVMIVNQVTCKVTQIYTAKVS